MGLLSRDGCVMFVSVRLLGVLDGVELPEGLVEVVVDVFVFDVECMEDCLVEHASLLLVAASIQLVRLFE
ncbi:hypothetical protein CEP50_02830 [Actinopolyspora mortivallis]|uniref:Uncharacterized protein n=1 Tax=Actinopolyspora mortivallis TaxID=33906 RepID=A0A2T0H088_ACTMO|nr:hypothetical protein CEP50_02830 [Actinopolyspora mortivallis]